MSKVIFAHFPKPKHLQHTSSVGVPFIVLRHDWKDNISIPELNRAIDKLTFNYGPTRIVDITKYNESDEYIYIVTLKRDKHTPRQWERAFNEYFYG